MGLKDELTTLLAREGDSPTALPLGNMDKKSGEGTEPSSAAASHQEDTVNEEMEKLKAQIAALTQERDTAFVERDQAQKGLQELQASVAETEAEKDGAIASLQSQIEAMRHDILKRSRVAELVRSLSEAEQEIVASMTDEQWALYKETASAAVQPPFRRDTLKGDAPEPQKVTLV